MFGRWFSKPPELTLTYTLNTDINRYILTSNDNKRMIYNLMYTFKQGPEDELFLESCTTKTNFAERYAQKEKVNIGILVKLSDICYMVDRDYSYEKHGIKTIYDIIYSFSDLSKLFLMLDKKSKGRNIFSKQALTDAQAIIDKLYPNYDHNTKAMSTENCTMQPNPVEIE